LAGFLERYAVVLARDKGGQLAKLAQAVAERVDRVPPVMVTKSAPLAESAW
jgi:hypothetical protein